MNLCFSCRNFISCLGRVDLPARTFTSIRDQFVPKHDSVTTDDVSVAQEFLIRHRKILVLTGAGISTESGVPDYRSEEVGLYARSNHKPTQYHEFVQSEALRRRYWARNYVGFEQFAAIKPNIAHTILADWENRGDKLQWIVTQNVDRLHQKAGSSKVTELHGSGFIVKCLNVRNGSCDYSIDRFEFQRVLDELNPQLCDMDTLDTLRTIRPDGDIDLSPKLVENFKVPSCPKCRGILKPDIIFFGDNVPSKRVEFVYEQLDESDSLLVIGSSLYVYSGYRFALTANEKGIPIMIINIGPSRADKLPGVISIRRRVGELLPLIDISNERYASNLS